MIFSKKNRFYNVIRLLKSLSIRKIYNFLLILTGYALSTITGKARVYALPFSVTFEISSICNLKCPQCLSGRGEIKRENSFISRDFVMQVLSLLKGNSFYAIFYMQGEPLLNKEFDKLIKTAKTLNYYTYLSTNGILLTQEVSEKILESGLDHIVVSVDGISHESYEFYRSGGDLSKVVSGVKNLIGARKKSGLKRPFIEMQFLVNKQNEHELDDVADFSKNTGFDMLSFKSMQVYDNANKFLPDDKRFNRYLKPKNKRNKRACFRLWSHAVFTSDEKLAACCYDKIPEYATTFSPCIESFAKEWKHGNLNDFRRQVLKNRQKINICNNCDD